MQRVLYSLSFHYSGSMLFPILLRRNAEVILKFFVKEAQVAVPRTAGNIINRAISIGEQERAVVEFFTLNQILEGLTGCFFDQGGQIVGIEVEMLRGGCEGAVHIMILNIFQNFNDRHLVLRQCARTIRVVLEHTQQFVEDQQHIGIHHLG